MTTFWDDESSRDGLAAVALGERPAEFVIRSGRLVNVFSGEVYPADVAIASGRIAAVGDVDRCVGTETRVFDAQDRYLVPGFIDTHLHVGASALVPSQLARLVVPLGTAAIVTDFSEPGQMMGVTAIRTLLDEAAATPLKVYLSPFYVNLLEIAGLPPMPADEFEDMLSWPETIELREWGVFVERSANAGVAAIGARARELGLRVGGHLKGMAGPTLQASAAIGAQSDHEAYSAEEAMERARLGVAVQVRYSSGRRLDLPNVLQAVTRHACDPRLFMFCTDEEDVDEIADLGHLDHRVRWAIELGVAPIEAIRMASLNAAAHLGLLADLGSISPGRLGFVNLVDDLAAFRVSTVIAGRHVVGQDGRFVGPIAQAPDYPAEYSRTIRIRREIRANELALQTTRSPRVRVRVIAVDPAVPGTQEHLLELPTSAGNILPDLTQDVAKIVVVDRHSGEGRLSAGFLKGYGLERGAFGFSFHPGGFNIALLGMSDVDLAITANRIVDLQGGFVCALEGEVLYEIPLPIFGYLSAEPAERIVECFREMRRVIAEDLGCDVPGLYTAFGYLCLPDVAPRLRMTCDGLQSIEFDGSGMSSRIVPVALE